MKEYFSDIAKQEENSKTPVVRPNETLGRFSLDIYGVEECAALFKYMESLRYIGGYYYDVRPNVIARLCIKDGFNWIGEPFADLMSRSIITSGGYKATDKIDIQYWITNKDGANNSTKPSELLELELESKNA